MKRASDVPPVVERRGRRPVCALDGLDEELDEGTRLGEERLRMAALEGDAVGHLIPSAVCARRWRTHASSRSRVHSSLKRMLKEARASAGMTLKALLPTSTVVTSRLEGSKWAVPGVERLAPIERRKGGASMPVTGFLARCG